MGKPVDITGQRFGRLIVVSRTDNAKGGHTRWLCRCDCGTKKVISSCNLKSGHTKSCGCLQKERSIEGSTKHGHTSGAFTSQTYNCWVCMIYRCSDLSNKHYGGRGIMVCRRWRKFENFLKDMGECPEGHSIDRIDNDGNYEPGNCKWATRQEQARNKRNNHLITHDGRTQCLTDWAEELNINVYTLSFRLNEANWPTEEALTTPVGQKRASQCQKK